MPPIWFAVMMEVSTPDIRRMLKEELRHTIVERAQNTPEQGDQWNWYMWSTPEQKVML